MHVFPRAIVCYAIYRDGALFEQGRATWAEARGRAARLAHLHPDFEWTAGTSPVPGFIAAPGAGQKMGQTTGQITGQTTGRTLKPIPEPGSVQRVLH